MSCDTDAEMHRQNLEKFSDFLCKKCVSLDVYTSGYELACRVANQIAFLTESNLCIDKLVERLENNPSHCGSVLRLNASRKDNLKVIGIFASADLPRDEACSKWDKLLQTFDTHMCELYKSYRCVPDTVETRRNGVPVRCYAHVDAYSEAITEFLKDVSATRHQLCFDAATIVRRRKL